MPYPNFHSARIKNPGEFQEKSFRTILLPGSGGVKSIIGRLKGETSTTVQAYRFPKGKFTVSQAKAWLKRNNVKYISFEKATNDSIDPIINSVQRYDVMDDTNFFLTKTFKKDENGFLNGDAIVTNIGVFTYKFQDGTIIRELRCPEEVLHPDSLETLKMKPITNNHPKNLVTIDNIKEVQVGTTGSSVHSDAYAVAVPISIQDRKTIDDIDNGKMSLSCGYKADLEYIPGMWAGVEYDAIQRNIRYNHVAIVNRARAGDLAKIRLDDNEAILSNENFIVFDDVDNTNNQNNNNGGVVMPDNLKTIKLDDGIDYRADAEVIREFTALKKALKKADQVKIDYENYKKDREVELSKLKADLDTANDKLKDTTEKIEKLEKENLSDEAIQKAIEERMLIVDQAVKAGIEVKKDITNIDLKKAVVMKVFARADLKDKDDVYIDARYDAAKEVLEDQPNLNNKKKVFANNSQARQDEDEENIVKDAYSKYVESLNNNWKEGK